MVLCKQSLAKPTINELTSSTPQFAGSKMQ